MDTTTTPLERLRVEAFARWISHFPEDAATLGLREASARLRAPSEAGDAAVATAMRDQLAEVAKIDPSTLTPEEAVDLALLERHARFTLHTTEETKLGATSLEPSILPHAALAFQLFQLRGDVDVAAVEERLRALPAYLAERTSRLVASARRGHAFDRDTTRSFVEELFPDAASFAAKVPEVLRARGATRVTDATLGLANAAADAFREHAARLASDVLPSASDAYALGREEYELRVASFFGAPLDLDELVREAREDLAAAQSAIVTRARILATKRGGSVRDLRDASALFFELWQRHPREGTRPADLYTEATARIVQRLAHADVVEVPEGCTLHMVPRPPGVAPGAPSTNWPVPLRDPEGRGLLLVGEERGDHSVPATMNLAIHEGIPGHYLQSFRWREIFGGDEAPLRFLLVTDDVAMAHQDFWAMPSIEGWAVRMEELCLEEGLHDEEEAMLAVVAKAIRALRVIGDIGLHTGALDKEAVAALMCEEACMPLGWGRGQAARYTRIGVQAITYAVGAKQIAALESEARSAWGARFSRRAFYAWLLAFGPVPPLMLAQFVTSAAP